MSKVRFNKEFFIDYQKQNFKIVQESNEFFIVINDDNKFGEDGVRDGKGFQTYKEALNFLKQYLGDDFPKHPIMTSGILSFGFLALFFVIGGLTFIFVQGGVKEVFLYFGINNTWAVAITSILLGSLIFFGFLLPRLEKIAKKIEKYEKG